MNSKRPSYITQNRLGIFLFQYRIPKRYGIKQIFFRISLRTRENKQALRQARKLAVIMEEILQEYYNDPDQLKIALREAKRTFQDPEHLKLALDLHRKNIVINSEVMPNWYEAERALGSVYQDNLDININSTRLISNQRGYPNEKISDFKENLKILL